MFLSTLPFYLISQNEVLTSFSFFGVSKRNESQDKLNCCLSGFFLFEVVGSWCCVKKTSLPLNVVAHQQNSQFLVSAEKKRVRFCGLWSSFKEFDFKKMKAPNAAKIAIHVACTCTKLSLPVWLFRNLDFQILSSLASARLWLIGKIHKVWPEAARRSDDGTLCGTSFCVKSTLDSPTISPSPSKNCAEIIASREGVKPWQIAIGQSGRLTECFVHFRDERR